MQRLQVSAKELFTEFRAFQRKFDALTSLNDSLVKFNSRFGAAVDGLALNSAAYEFEVDKEPPPDPKPGSGEEKPRERGAGSRKRARGAEAEGVEPARRRAAGATASDPKSDKAILHRLGPKLPVKYKTREHLLKLEFVLRMLVGLPVEGALSDVVKTAETSVLQANEYLGTLVRLGHAVRRQERGGLRYYANPDKYRSVKEAMEKRKREAAGNVRGRRR